MSYSARDIEEAFYCIGNGKMQEVQTTKGQLFAHLEGRCDCLLRRCPACGERETNKFPVHKEKCPMRMKS